MGLIFNIIAGLLQLISELTGFTYKEINIIVYYMFIPFIYISLIDKIIKKHFLKFLYLGAMVIFLIKVKDFETFSEHLFALSVLFLDSFKAIGWDYIVASVMICVIFPGILFVGLVYLAFKVEIHQNWRKKLKLEKN